MAAKQIGLTVSKKKAFDEFASWLNKKSNRKKGTSQPLLKLSGCQMQQGFNTYKTKYSKAKLLEVSTGGGVTEEDLAQNIFTVSGKQEDMCPSFRRMNEIFGKKANVTPLAEFDSCNVGSFGALEEDNEEDTEDEDDEEDEREKVGEREVEEDKDEEEDEDEEGEDVVEEEDGSNDVVSVEVEELVDATRMPRTPKTAKMPKTPKRQQEANKTPKVTPKPKKKRMEPLPSASSSAKPKKSRSVISVMRRCKLNDFNFRRIC